MCFDNQSLWKFLSKYHVGVTATKKFPYFPASISDIPAPSLNLPRALHTAFRQACYPKSLRSFYVKDIRKHKLCLPTYFLQFLPIIYVQLLRSSEKFLSALRRRNAKQTAVWTSPLFHTHTKLDVVYDVVDLVSPRAVVKFEIKIFKMDLLALFLLSKFVQCFSTIICVRGKIPFSRQTDRKQRKWVIGIKWHNFS